MNQHKDDLLDLDSLLNTTSVKRRYPTWVSVIPVLAAALILLVVGFLIGFQGAVWQEITEPTPPPRAAALNPPESMIISESDFATCYMYLEPLTETPYKDGLAFYDGISYYVRGKYPEEFGGSLTDRFNFWLRVELSQVARDTYTAEDKLSIRAPLDISWDDSYLGTTPYFDPGTGEMEGWFIFGWLARKAHITLLVNGEFIPTMTGFDISPCVCAANLNKYSTDTLVDLVLFDDTFWITYNKSEPEDLSLYLPLLALSRREDCIPILLERLLCSPSWLQKRVIIMLDDFSSIRKLMTDEQRWQFMTLLEDYYTVIIYDYALTQHQTTSPPEHAASVTYFRDKESSYQVSSEVPEVLQGDVKINFCARVELTAYYKTQYEADWVLHAENENRGAQPQHKATLAAREYYDKNGNVAGWFVYGHVPVRSNIEFWLDGSTPGTIADYSIVLPVIPEISTVITVGS